MAVAQLEEVIVTATKRSQSTQDIAVAVTAMTESTLDDFGMDYREVTVADFQEFVAATAGTMPAPPPWGWGDSDLPIVNVTWNEAAAFAAWAGKRLPSEAEFEYAMRGGAADQRYPWGDTISAGDANYQGAGVGQPTVAESYPSSEAGLYDIAGNVNEWCYDVYGNYPSASKEAVADAPTTDVESKTSRRVLRGGSFANQSSKVRSANRKYIRPADRGYNVGFRPSRTYPLSP